MQATLAKLEQLPLLVEHAAHAKLAHQARQEIQAPMVRMAKMASQVMLAHLAILLHLEPSHRHPNVLIHAYPLVLLVHLAPQDPKVTRDRPVMHRRQHRLEKQANLDHPARLVQLDHLARMQTKVQKERMAKLSNSLAPLVHLDHQVHLALLDHLDPKAMMASLAIHPLLAHQVMLVHPAQLERMPNLVPKAQKAHQARKAHAITAHQPGHLQDSNAKHATLWLFALYAFNVILDWKTAKVLYT